jgi:predicted CXXCH cytochrome family protein
MEGSFWSDGQVRVSGREFNGLSASGCYTRGKLSCLSCHSMHGYQSNDDQLIPRLEGNQACIQCHEQIGADVARHTRHANGSSGSLCYNCHMPHTTYGLLKAIRSHTIDSPSVKASLATGRPNACNLCHLDRTLEWTAVHLRDGYGQAIPPLNQEQKTVSAALTWMLKGDAGQRALVAWHFGWEPARKASNESWMASHLAQLLTDPYSAVRYVAQRSLKRLPGLEDFQFDYIAPADLRTQAQVRAFELAARNVHAPSNAAVAAALLLDGNGSVEREKVSELLRRRNNRRMELLE